MKSAVPLSPNCRHSSGFMSIPIADIACRVQFGSMGQNLSDELRRDRRAARRSYSASLMSNSKWRAVFAALESDTLGLRQIAVKFTDDAEAKAMDLPWLYAPHAFVDSLAFGPFPLVSIEWIEVPNVAIFPRRNDISAEQHVQDTNAARSALLALGKQLPLVDTATGLRIVGHVR
jgi:hypothetical protein